MLTGIAFFQWIDDYLYSFFSDEGNNTIRLEDNKYYHLKDKMYEEEYLSKKSKKATKDSIVKKLKENIQYLDEFSEGTAKRTFCDYLLKDDVLNKMIKQYKEDERIKEIDKKIIEILKQREDKEVYAADREERTERTERTSDSLNVSASLF